MKIFFAASSQITIYRMRHFHRPCQGKKLSFQALSVFVEILFMLLPVSFFGESLLPLFLAGRLVTLL